MVVCVLFMGGLHDNLCATWEQVLHLQATTLADIQVGDVLIEINLEQTFPKVRPCILTEHDKAGTTFHIVVGHRYQLIINIFREGGTENTTPRPTLTRENPVRGVSRYMAMLLNFLLCTPYPNKT